MRVEDYGKRRREEEEKRETVAVRRGQSAGLGFSLGCVGRVGIGGMHGLSLGGWHKRAWGGQAR